MWRWCNRKTNDKLFRRQVQRLGLAVEGEFEDKNEFCQGARGLS
jgi:hypothetical protein